jgi:hypothetical protein
VASAKIPRDRIGRARQICDRGGIWMMRLGINLVEYPGFPSGSRFERRAGK